MLPNDESEPEKARDFFYTNNLATRIDAFEELSPTALAAIRVFFRKLGAAGFVDETLLPTLQDGDAQVFCTIRDRPWPPWGLGARTISAVCEAHSVAPDSWAISPVYVLDEEATNIGLITALYREVLESLAVSPNAEICYLVAEGSTLLDHALRSNGFRRENDVLMTEHARYFTYRTPASKLLEVLGLSSMSAPDLLSQELKPEQLARNALFHNSISIAGRAELWGVLRPELVRLPRGGHAGKPGGVPSGTGTNRPEVFPERDRWFVSFDRFLGTAAVGLIDKVAAQEANFRPATLKLQDPVGTVVDERIRRALTLDDVSFIEATFVERIKGSLESVLSKLGLQGFPIGRIELQVTASGQGDYFRMHRDASDDSTRVLSFVYFFHAEPRRFSGGELRLFSDSIANGAAHADRSQLLSPRQDMIVFFPSHLPHELLPVRVAKNVFKDRRFTINGWVHRASK